MFSIRSYGQFLASVFFLGVIATSAGAQQRADYGTLSIQVRPPDAEILIDGEKWTGPEGTAALQVQLAPGAHRVEIRSPQRDTFVRDVTIRAGETTPLNVSLSRSESSAAAAPLPPPPAEPAAPPHPGRQSSGTVHVTSNEDGFMIAPDYRITEINHHTGQLVGAYGGYVFAGQFLAGVGGYWQADSTNGTHLAYAGPVFEWRVFPDRTIGLNLHGLVGGGWRYADDSHYANFDGPRNDHRGMPVPVNAPYGIPHGWYDGDGFFVAEPEAQVVVRLGSSMRLQGGVGYRAVSENGLSGVSGSVSMQFGR
jgi:PEGA domain